MAWRKYCGWTMTEKQFLNTVLCLQFSTDLQERIIDIEKAVDLSTAQKVHSLIRCSIFSKGAFGECEPIYAEKPAFA